MTVTAFEARDILSIRRSSQVVAYFVLAIYLFCAIGEFLNVNWRDMALPQGYLNPSPSTGSPLSDRTDESFGSQAVIVIAALKVGDRGMAGFLNGCMMFSALSAANTSLYLASRILYGMTRKVNPLWMLGFVRSLGSVWNRTGVPVRSLCLSFIAFFWLPFLRLKKGIAVADVSSFR